MGEPETLRIADPAVRRQYREQMASTGLVISSFMMDLLNTNPLASDPRAPAWLEQSIDAAQDLGAAVILVAFFGKGNLLQDNQLNLIHFTTNCCIAGPTLSLVLLSSYSVPHTILALSCTSRCSFVRVTLTPGWVRLTSGAGTGKELHIDGVGGKIAWRPNSRPAIAAVGSYCVLIGV